MSSSETRTEPSRRALFNLFLKPIQHSFPDEEELATSEIHETQPHRSLSRRQFVQMLCNAAALGVAGLLRNNNSVKAESRQPIGKGAVKPDAKEQPKQQVQQPPQKENATPLTKTLAQTGLLTIGEIITAVVGEKLGIPIGMAKSNATAIKSELLRHPGQALFNGVIKGPIIEELLCRLLPSAIVSGLGGKGRVWEVGVPISALFALGHNVEYDEMSHRNRLNLENIPLTHFVKGVFYWYLMRDRGFEHPLVAHMATNAAVEIATIVSTLNKTHPDQKQQSPSKMAPVRTSRPVETYQPSYTALDPLSRAISHARTPNDLVKIIRANGGVNGSRNHFTAEQIERYIRSGEIDKITRSFGLRAKVTEMLITKMEN